MWMCPHLFPEMWYGVFLWAVVSSLVFHLPAALLSLATLRQHKIARFMPIAIFLMGIVGPLCGGVLTSKNLFFSDRCHVATAPMVSCVLLCLKAPPSQECTRLRGRG